MLLPDQTLTVLERQVAASQVPYRESPIPFILYVKSLVVYEAGRQRGRLTLLGRMPDIVPRGNLLESDLVVFDPLGDELLPESCLVCDFQVLSKPSMSPDDPLAVVDDPRRPKR